MSRFGLDVNVHRRGVWDELLHRLRIPRVIAGSMADEHVILGEEILRSRSVSGWACECRRKKAEFGEDITYQQRS